MSTLFSFLVLLCSGISSIQDEIPLEVRFGQQVRSALMQSASGEATPRILLFMLENRPQNPDFPSEGPFPLNPGPTFAWQLTPEQVREGARDGTLMLGTPDSSFPRPLALVSGRYRAQLALILDGTALGRSREVRVNGEVFELDLDPDRTEGLTMTVNGSIPPPPSGLGSNERIDVISLPSPILTEDRDGEESWTTRKHKAFVVLPDAYEQLDAPRRRWPVIYMIPGSKAAIEHARSIAKLLHEPLMKDLIPQAIWVVLDPMSEFGHHFFIDSELHGRRSEALAEELVPWLDVRYRTIPEADARLLLGEHQGGRAALTLLLDHPDVFSKAWALSPDAVAFEALGCLDLARDGNAYTELDGSQRPAMRTVLNADREIVHLDVEDEVMLCRTLRSNGTSGQTWDELRAAFGSVPVTKDLPGWPFDPETGRMRPAEVRHWMLRDLTGRVRNQPRLARRLSDDARIFTGTCDERYRNLGVRFLQKTIELALEKNDRNENWIVELEEADSESANAISRLPVHDEIITTLREDDLHE